MKHLDDNKTYFLGKVLTVVVHGQEAWANLKQRTRVFMFSGADKKSVWGLSFFDGLSLWNACSFPPGPALTGFKLVWLADFHGCFWLIFQTKVEPLEDGDCS